MTFDPKKPVRTRCGGEARILCDDFVGDSPIVAALKRIDGREYVQYYGSDGHIITRGVPDHHDLVNIPERVERWANVYGPEFGAAGSNHHTKEDADFRSARERSGLIKLVYEGDKLVEVTLEKSENDS